MNKIVNKFFGKSKSARMITLGFTGVIILVLVLVLFFIKKVNTLEHYVHDSATIGQKIDLNSKMFISARERMLIIFNMMLADDPIIIEGLLSNYYSKASDFLLARRKLITLLDTDIKDHNIEYELLADQQIVTTRSVKAQTEVVEFLRGGDEVAAKTLMRDKLIPLQTDVLASLMALNAHLLEDFDELSQDVDNELYTAKRDLSIFMILIIGMIVIVAIKIRSQVGTYEDVIKSDRDKATLLSMKDPLTGLTNRYGFEQFLNTLVEERNDTSTLMYLDLDQFKIVNDTCGHHAGDQLLRQLSTELRSIIKNPDVVARVGGDEFAIILTDCSVTNAVKVADRIRQTIEEYRFVWEDKIFTVSASIGITAIDGASKSKQEILIEADIACYSAKDTGRNRIYVHDATIDKVSRTDEMQQIHKINRALDEDLFEIHYQKLHNISTGDESKFEILVRRRDPDTGDLVPPGAFLPAAERFGKMPQIDRWVIENTFKIRKNTCMIRRTAEGYAACDLQHAEHMVFINISGASINDEWFLIFVKDTMRKYDINPHDLCFEITETVAITNMDNAIKLMNELKVIGCKFALDDFGAGMSSFGYLKNLPLDFIKINGSLVRDILVDEIDYAMLKSIIEISKIMGIKSIAEYVECAEVLRELKFLGVDYAQGYHIHKPERLTINNCCRP